MVKNMNSNPDLQVLRPLFPELTDGQIKCIYWFFLGLEVDGIAHMLSISEMTVRGHLDRARQNLNINRTPVLRQVVIARLCSPLIQRVLNGHSI